ALVLLADDQRPALRVPVVELLLELALDDAAFLLDDDDLLETLGESPNRLGLERPAHADLEQLDPDVAGARGVQAKIVERLQHVEVRFAGRDEAEPRIPAVDDRAVEGVRTRERERRRQLIPVQAQLLIVWRIRPADVQAARRHCEVRCHDVQRLRRQGEALGRVGGLLSDLQADPATAEARERIPVEPELDDLLDVGRVHDRYRRVNERELALVRKRRRLARVIVTRDRDDAAVARRSGRVAMLERVARAVDAGPLAVPHAEHAFVTSAREQVRLLGAPDRGGRKILVQTGLEADVRGVEVGRRAPQLAVEAAERRAAVAGDEARRVPAGEPVAIALRQQEAHERLQTGDEQWTGFLEPIPLVQPCDLP